MEKRIINRIDALSERLTALIDKINAQEQNIITSNNEIRTIEKDYEELKNVSTLELIDWFTFKNKLSNNEQISGVLFSGPTVEMFNRFINS